MCVVALAWNAHPRWRLLLAGNRDEFHPRPTAALAQWTDSGVIAGRDLQSGGTWVGLDRRGRVAVVTNVRDGLAQPHDGPSRGALPVGFLDGVADAADETAELLARAEEFAPFNLVLADAGGCWHVGNHPPQREMLAPGDQARIGPAGEPGGGPGMEFVAVAGQQQAPAGVGVPGQGDDAHGPLWSRCGATHSFCAAASTLPRPRPRAVMRLRKTLNLKI
jgi:hypothetical protein